MPVYEYHCMKCGHEMDHFHRQRHEPAPACGCCGAMALQRKVSLSSFHLRGGGWYVSDYGVKGHQGAAPVASGPSSTDGSREVGAPRSADGGTSKSSESATSARESQKVGQEAA